MEGLNLQKFQGAKWTFYLDVSRENTENSQEKDAAVVGTFSGFGGELLNCHNNS